MQDYGHGSPVSCYPSRSLRYQDICFSGTRKMGRRHGAHAPPYQLTTSRHDLRPWKIPKLTQNSGTCSLNGEIRAKTGQNSQPSTPEELALCVQIVPNGSIIACSTIGAWWTIGSSFMRLPMEPRRGHPLGGFREGRDRCRRQRSWRRPPTSRS